MKKFILIACSIIWLFLIFSLSNQNSIKSESLSDRVSMKIYETSEEIQEKMPEKEFVKRSRYYVRKTAHFLLYFVLNIILYFSLKHFGIKNTLLFSLSFCLIYAYSDEFHQLFVSGRSGQIKDIIIDFSGAIFSSLLIILFNYFQNFNKRLNRNID